MSTKVTASLTLHSCQRRLKVGTTNQRKKEKHEEKKGEKKTTSSQSIEWDAAVAFCVLAKNVRGVHESYITIAMHTQTSI